MVSAVQHRPPTREMSTPTREMFASGVTREMFVKTPTVEKLMNFALDPDEENAHSDSKLNERNTTMTHEEAAKIVEELGHIYAVALAEKGHNIDRFTPVFNGLAAYFMLKLEGEFDFLDKAVDVICRIIYQEVIRKITQGA
jgi:hypothetical protein